MAKNFAKAFYSSKAWRDTRLYILRRDLYTCAYCHCRASEIHHKIELTPQNIGDYNIALNPDNLISLCSPCHKKITQGYGDISDGYIFSDDGQVIKV